jgi:hypothetical protein
VQKVQLEEKRLGSAMPRATLCTQPEVTVYTVYLVLPQRHHALQIVFLILKLNNPLIELLTDGSPGPFQHLSLFQKLETLSHGNNEDIF